jgi:ribonuclease P protein component
MKRYSFPKEKRLRSNMLFRKVISSGQCVRDKILTIYIAKNEVGFHRLGVSVRKSYGNAVKRNCLKRLVREVFRLNQDRIPPGRDYLVLIKRKIENLSFKQIKDSFLSLVLQKNE